MTTMTTFFDNADVTNIALKLGVSPFAPMTETDAKEIARILAIDAASSLLYNLIAASDDGKILAPTGIIDELTQLYRGRVVVKNTRGSILTPVQFFATLRKGDDES